MLWRVLVVTGSTCGDGQQEASLALPCGELMLAPATGSVCNAGGMPNLCDILLSHLLPAPPWPSQHAPFHLNMPPTASPWPSQHAPFPLTRSLCCAVLTWSAERWSPWQRAKDATLASRLSRASSTRTCLTRPTPLYTTNARTKSSQHLSVSLHPPFFPLNPPFFPPSFPS